MPRRRNDINSLSYRNKTTSDPVETGCTIAAIGIGCLYVLLVIALLVGVVFLIWQIALGNVF